MTQDQPIERDVPRSGVPDELAATMTMAEQGEWLQSYWKRHSVTRRTAIAGSLGTFGVLAMNASPWASKAMAAARGAQAPHAYKPHYTGTNIVAGRHIGFGSDPTTTMYVSGEFFDTTGGRPTPASKSVVVDYGLDTNYGSTVTADIRQLVTTLPNGSTTYSLTQFFVHGTLSGLTPGTTYHWRFRLTTDGSSTSDSTFATAPASGSTAPFSFTAFADHGINYDPIPTNYKPASGATAATDDYYGVTNTKANNPPQDPFDTGTGRATTGRRQDGIPNRTQYPAYGLVDVISSQRPVFNLVGGDIAYADPSGNGLAEYYVGGTNPQPATSTTKGYPDGFDPTIWSAYFVQNERSAATTPWMFAVGNHDQEAVYDGNPQSYSSGVGNNYAATLPNHGYAGHAARINLVGRGVSGPSPSPTIYSFRYANVAVVAVDCNDLSKEIQANTGYTGGAQLTWLDRELAALRGDKTIDFIVAFFHHCAYATSSSHHSDQGVRNAIGPLFTKYQVDVAFQGHNHQFERSDPLTFANGVTTVGTTAPDTSTVTGWKGTTYINNGSAGRPRYGIDPDTQVTDPVTGTYTERFRSNPNVQGSENISGKIQVGGGTVADAVSWSQARYDDYAVCVIDVVPAVAGAKTTFTIRTLNDFGTEVDRVVFAKTAAANVPANLPEAPMALLLPASGLAIAGGYLAYRHLGGRADEAILPV